MIRRVFSFIQLIMEKQFISFSQVSEKERVLAIDCHHPKAFALSHWRGAMPLCDISDDTSGGIVLNAIKQQIPEMDYPYVTNNHFDIDGFVGIWSACNPELALKYEKVLREMAIIGDFRELDLGREGADQALKLVCWMNAEEKDKFYRPFGYLEQEGRESELCVEKYIYFLKAFESVLKQTEAYRKVWLKEYEQMMAHYLLLKSSACEVKKVEDIRLHIVKSPEPLHYYALYSGSEDSDMVLSIYEGGRFELEYKYTTWVDTAHRCCFPRIDLQPLADRLNSVEKSDQHWYCEKITDTGPILRLENNHLNKAQRYDHPCYRTILSSTIDPEALQKIVIDYFREIYRHTEKQQRWSWKEMKSFNNEI
jgi:hypothetical protein